MERLWGRVSPDDYVGCGKGQVETGTEGGVLMSE